MTLGAFFGSFGRREAAPSRASDPATADAFDGEDAPGLDAEMQAFVAGALSPPDADAAPPAAADLAAAARRDADAATQRIAELEENLRSTLERLGRRTTEVRNLEARLKVMDPMVDQVRQRDLWLDDARKETRKAIAERDAEAERRRALESDVASLRKEVDWRDYVIRDLESMPGQLRERDALLIKLRKDHAAALAERDAELARLRGRVAAA